MKGIDQPARNELLERFLRYVQIETTSDRHRSQIPSTEGQWDLIKLLQKELQDVGVGDLEVTPNGHIVARIPGTVSGKSLPTIGFMAHIDTSSDAPGDGVRPQIHEHYDGGVIEVGEGLRLDPAEFPALAEHAGQTIITSDGRTLLGADDKAGVAEIMTAVSWLLSHPDHRRPPLEIIFTPDEETGRGLDGFPVDRLAARCCYTMDGGEEATVETECFNAYQVRAKLTGRVIHLGTARGKLVNAVTMAATFLSMLPASESPEATDGRFGYYCPVEIKGGLEQAEIDIFIRDFERSGIARRLDVLRSIAHAVQTLYHPGKCELEEKHQYSNMNDYISKDPLVSELLLEAVRRGGMEPRPKVIRGGTDGAHLSEMGVPTPNIFTGGHNYHSRLEWAAFSTMEKAVVTLLNLVELWAAQT